VTWLIIIFVIHYFALARPGIETKWKQEQSPPEQVSILRLGINGEVLGQTPGGDLYELFAGWNQPWKRVTEPAKNPEPPVFCQNDNAGAYLILPPPGKVASRVSEYCYSIDVGHHLEVVLLENGEVWSWRYESDAIFGFVLECAFQVANLLGALFVLIGLGIKIRQWVKTQT
jgi:hypothetical protein